jgi:hypothetical protein
MSSPLDEIKRLRAELAERDKQLAELRGLVQAHLEATSDDPEMVAKLEHAAFERGYEHGDEMGWRRGVEHALMAVDEAHLKGDAHDLHGQMRNLGMHSGPVPPRMTPDEILERAEEYDRLRAEWWWKEDNKEHQGGQAEKREPGKSRPSKVRELHPGKQIEREAG